MAASTDQSKLLLAQSFMKITKVKIRHNQKIARGSVVFLYKSNDIDVIQKYKSLETGTVSEILVKEGEDVKLGDVLLKLQGCSHPTVMKDMCADCGADLRMENSTAGNRKEDVSASVAMVHSIPELIVSEQMAQELGRADEENLVKTRKLVLLVDLDQTLIHTTNDNIPPNLKDVHHYQLWHGNQLLWYHTRLRPHTETFLEHISKLYEMHICTFGSRIYAHTIAKILDPDGKYFSHRILSRDECFNAQSKTANLKALFPCGDAMVCIIDDREDVWHYSSNLVHVKPYRFFQGTADINAPPGLTKTEEDDKPIVHRVRKVSVSSTGSVEENGERTSTADCENKEGNTCETTFDQAATEAKEGNSGKESNEQEAPEKQEGEKCVCEAEEKMSNKGEAVESDSKMDIQDESTEEASSKSDNKEVDLGEKEGDSGQNVPADANETESCGKNSEARTDSEIGVVKESQRGTADNLEEASKKNGEIELIEWDDEDDYLFYLEEILKTIHSTFYDFYDQLKEKGAEKEKQEKPSLKNLIPYIKKKALRGCNILFSGVIPTNMSPEKSRAYIVAKSLGASIHTELKTKDNEVDPANFTTHLVAAKSGTSKVRAALKYKYVKKVNADWLWSCSERWEKVEEMLFPLPASAGDYDSGRDSPDLLILQKTSKSSVKRKRGEDTETDSDGSDVKKVKSNMDSVNDVESSMNFDKDESSIDSETDKTDKNETEMAFDLEGSGDKPGIFSMSYNPVLAFSDDDLAYMDKEVDDEMDDGDQSSEDDDSRDTRIRKQVLKSVGENESSSEESLSGDRPRGWGLKKMSPKSSSDDEMKGSSSPDDQLGPEYESETDQDKFDKIMDAFGPDTEDSGEEYDESIGSADEEIADAVMKEFLS